MTAQLLNRDVFLRDPARNSLPNDGVTKVDNTAALAFELETFVCEGEYRRGLFQILDTYLSHLGLTTQPSAWVSGFYGSGKSHLVKILEALWQNKLLENGQYPRDTATLPDDIKAQFVELSNQAKRAGGLWSASGMLSESSQQSVRMLLLGIVYKAAGLSSNYGRAKFRLWVRERGWEADIVSRIEVSGLDPESEFEQYLASPVIADAVHELSAMQSADPATAQARWDTQFNRDDIDIDEMESALRQVLKMQSSDGKQIPLTLIVLDEVQQYIGENGTRTQAVQEAVERIQSAFDSKVLIVATGQAQLTGTSNLQKLKGRFTGTVMLTDKDIEQVVREVVLQKNPVHMPKVQEAIARVEGEIDRHLQATQIGPRSDDKQILAEDYPLLATRSRFWARLLHRLDPTGTAGQLRTQLRIVHAATVHISDKPLGHVIPADFIYPQLQGGLHESGMLSRDVSNLIADQEDGTEAGRLRARLIQLIYLIEQLTDRDLIDAGIMATADNLADLLVEDLAAGSSSIRQRIPELLQTLEDDGKLMRGSDGAYAIQTGESLKWMQAFQQERLALSRNPGSLGDLRNITIENLFRDRAKSLRKTHGVSKTSRDISIRFGNETQQAAPGESQVIVWVRDGWGGSETTVRQDARTEGDDSPLINVYIRQSRTTDVATALEIFEAAKRTLELRGGSQDSPEGRQAANSMRNRMTENENRFRRYLQDAVDTAVLYQGGGAEVEGSTLQEKLQTAFDSSLKRQFLYFGEGDALDWDKVFNRAVQGNADALKAIGHQGDDADHPVIRKIREQIPGGTGISWGQLRKQFESSPYGWPRDAIDGAVAVMVNSGSVNVVQNGKELRVKDLNRQQAATISLVSEDIVISKMEWLAARKPFVEMYGTTFTDESVRADVRKLMTDMLDLVARAGGEPPRPLTPVPAYLREMQDQTGNSLVKSLAQNADQLVADIKVLKQRAEEIENRFKTWVVVEGLANHAERLPEYASIHEQIEAIRVNRQLLATPDPVAAVSDRLREVLRAALNERIERFDDLLQTGLAELQASQEWDRLSDVKRSGFLAKSILKPVPPPSLSSHRDVLTALQNRSLGGWDTMIDAFSNRLNQIQLEVIREVEPKTVEVSLDKTVMTKPIDVENWIRKTKEALLHHVNNGHPVRIK